MRRSSSSFAARDYPHQRTTGALIAAAYQVHAALGYGFLEAVYRRALAVELEYMGLSVAREATFELHHRGVSIGVYRADLVVERCVVVEVKAGPSRDPFAQRQLLNYLRSAHLEVGLVIEFGPRVEIRRVANLLGRA